MDPGRASQKSHSGSSPCQARTWADLTHWIWVWFGLDIGFLPKEWTMKWVLMNQVPSDLGIGEFAWICDATTPRAKICILFWARARNRCQSGDVHPRALLRGRLWSAHAMSTMWAEVPSEADWLREFLAILGVFTSFSSESIWLRLPWYPFQQ